MIPFIPYSVLHLVDAVPLSLAALLPLLVLLPAFTGIVHFGAVSALVLMRLAGEFDAVFDTPLGDGALPFGKLLGHVKPHLRPLHPTLPNNPIKRR